jgi:cardiolipin synthase
MAQAKPNALAVSGKPAKRDHQAAPDKTQTLSGQASNDSADAEVVCEDLELPEEYCSFACEVAGNRFEFHPSGIARRRALLDFIACAKHSLKLSYFEFGEDGIGDAVRDALTAAQKRGVKVSLLVDDFGAKASKDFFAELIDAGADFACFNPKRGRRYFIRNHQKIAIADDSRAIMGGFNLEDDYFNTSIQYGWEDIGLEVKGPIVDRLVEWYGQLCEWTLDPKAQLRAIRSKVKDWDPGEGPVRLLIGGPSRRNASWEREIRRLFMRGKRLDLIVAYFGPPRRWVKRIARIAQRGHARLILAAQSDNPATVGASRALYAPMLRKGVKIYEFQPTKLHAKIIVVDDKVHVGSSNLDMRSIYINLEIMLQIDDAKLASRIRQYLDQRQAVSEEITPERYEEMRSPWCRVNWWAAWFLTSVLDYTVSRKTNLGL